MATLNGWPVVAESAVTRVYVGGDTDGCTVLAGDVAKAFAWLMQQFHDRVEPITEANGWRSADFNKRIGGAARSNHISGTAVDLNGGRHPYEKHQPGRTYRSGFSTAQTAQIRKILVESGGLFRWGLDFPVGLRDAMHFELAPGSTPAAVKTFVRKVEDMAITDADIKTLKAKLVPEIVAELVKALPVAVWGYKNPKIETRDAFGILRSAKGDTEHLVKSGS
ncbi:MAG: M15 family metallopeptidase [Cellulomonas sp.]|nr:D-Ala-D-Ala carboxypeptidase family metallohydrolase [Cellulomonas sp.]MCR6649696.1 M15 family metallopeptidase [Cellulomonas sp.]